MSFSRWGWEAEEHLHTCPGVVGSSPDGVTCSIRVPSPSLMVCTPGVSHHDVHKLIPLELGKSTSCIILHPSASFQFLWLQVVLGGWPHHCSFPACLLSTWCHSSGGHCSCLTFILIIVPGFLVNLEPSCFVIFNLIMFPSPKVRWQGSSISQYLLPTLVWLADWDKPRVKSTYLFFDALQRLSSLHCDGPWESSVISTRQ